MLWDDREDFRPLGHRLQRVDQEAYCDKLQPPVLRKRPERKRVGEFADMEIDQLFEHGNDWWDRECEPVPPRKGIAAPPLVPAQASIFPELPKRCGVCLCEEPNHERHCVIGYMNGYTSLEPPLSSREMEVLEWKPFRE